MNQADTSVEGLDVSFLRRWEPFYLFPNEDVLTEFFSQVTDEESHKLAKLLVKVWTHIDQRLKRGRGGDFMIGHGIFMGNHQSLTLANNCGKVS